MMRARGPRKNTCSVFFASVLIIAGFGVSAEVGAETYRVDTQDAYRKALKKLTPGDEIVLANGVWRDFEIV
ncbi:MAG: hypothetical protein AAFU58_06855, partial [Pseudomonadota bacterium]